MADKTVCFIMSLLMMVWCHASPAQSYGYEDEEYTTMPEDADDNSDQLDIPQDVADTLDYLVDPDIPKAVDETEKLNEMEKNITVEHKGGFEFLNMASQFQSTKGIRKRILVKHIKKELEGFKGQKQVITDIIENILDHVANGKTKQPDGLFSIISDVGNGFAKALFMYYKQRSDGKYNLKKVKFEGKVKLAATLVITRISKSNSTYSESKDIISYIPRDNATKNDVNELLNIMIPDLSKLLNNLPDSEKPRQRILWP